MTDDGMQDYRTSLSEGGECGRLIAAFDWAATPLGPLDGWLSSLRTATALLLRSAVPIVMLWGEDGIMLYNDAYSVFAGGRHPELIGSKVREGWPEVADFNDNVMKVGLAGGTLAYRDQELTLNRHGRPEQVFMDLDYSPVIDDTGRPAGVLAIVVDTTVRVLAERRRAFLLELESLLRDLDDPVSMIARATAAIGRQLGAARVAFGEVDEAGPQAIVRSDWTDGRLPSVVGRWSIDDFGPDLAGSVRAGQTVAIGDLRDNPRTVLPETAAFAFLPARALLAVPLIRGGRMAAVLFVNHAEPHDWTAGDIALAQDVAGRLASSVERARAEVAHDRAAALGTAQNRVLQLAMGDATLGDTLEAIVQTVEGLSTSGVLASILLLDADGVHMRHGAAPSLPAAYNAAIDGVAAGPNVGSCGTAIFRGEAVFVTDIASDPLWADFRDLALDHGLRACWSIPIRSSRGTVVGTFAMYHREPRDPTPADLEIVDFVVRTAGLVIERSNTGTAIRRSEARYRQIVEGAEGFAIVTFDAGGRVTGWNSGAAHIVGNGAEAAIGRPGDFFYSPADRADGVFADEIERARRDGRAINERWHVRPDGARFWGSGLMMPLAMDDGGFLKIFRDRTAEHEAEAALRDSETRLRLAVDNADVGFWDVDVVADTLTWPPLTKAMFGISPHVSVTLRDFYDGLHPDDRAATGAAFAAAADPARRALYDVEYRTVGKEDGVVRWVAAKGRGVFDAAGRCVRVTGTAVQITARKAAEEALRELNATLEARIATAIAEREAAQEALRQSQKMEAIGQLTGGVAHDFNNLLTPILGSLDMLQRRGLGGEREQRLIAGAAQSAERARLLVQRLLAFARRQPLQPVAVDLATLVTGMGDLLSSTTGPRIRILVDTPDGLPPARADPNQLEMAILNLAVNARDAMPDGGTLRLSVGREAVRPGHRAQLPTGHYLRLSVADTGTGMDETTRARAAEPFFSTKGVGKGTGLGLSMVHGLASQLGGGITIDSRSGDGTTIDLWLPQSMAEVASVDPAVEAAAPVIVGTALLVDDEEFVRMSTADMLHDLGYRVIEAASAEDAMALVEAGEPFDLLVTDYIMPGMNGTALALAVRDHRPGVPVLIVTGYAENDGASPDLPRLTKPFRKHELAASLSRL